MRIAHTSLPMRSTSDRVTDTEFMVPPQDGEREALHSVMLKLMRHRKEVRRQKQYGDSLDRQSSCKSTSLHHDEAVSLNKLTRLHSVASRSTSIVAVKRRRTGYGISMTDGAAAKVRYKRRHHLSAYRLKIANWCLAMATVGIVLAVIDAELTANMHHRPIAEQDYTVTNVIRTVILLSTVCLVALVVMYHATEANIFIVETASDHWHVAWTCDRTLKLLAEMLLCGICPIPATGTIPLYLFDIGKATHDLPNDVVNGTVVGTYADTVPLDVVLIIPMFARSYLICRWMVLHSRQFKDTATRTIASLNQVAVDFQFVMKTKLSQQPLKIIFLFTLVFWVIVTWTITQCERYATPDEPTVRGYLNYAWFVIVTYFSIGYGDIVPQSYCGRAMAIFSGVVGLFVSSIFIAVMVQRIDLTRAEKQVNQVVAQSQTCRNYRVAAACVLQYAWLTHKYERLGSSTKFTLSQKRLLSAINDFRRVKWRKRLRQDEIDEFSAIRRSQIELYECVTLVLRKQSEFNARLSHLTQALDIVDVDGRATRMSNATRSGATGPPLLRREGSASDANCKYKRNRLSVSQQASRESDNSDMQRRITPNNAMSNPLASNGPSTNKLSATPLSNNCTSPV